MAESILVSKIEAQAMLDAKERVINALAMFRPTEAQEPFFRKMADDGVLEMLLGGGVRSGKTVSCAIYWAAMCLNQPVILNDGTKLNMRPSRWRKEPLRLWSVSYNLGQIGRVIYKVLMKADLFRIIKDGKTGQWRSWNPLIPDDKDRHGETKPSPPLIRNSDVLGGLDGIAWEDKKAHQMKAMTLKHDGTTIEFFPSTGDLPAGTPCHAIWIDEKLASEEEWMPELLSRLIDYRGRIIWTSYPGTAPSASMEAITDRSVEQLGKIDATSFAITLKGSENQYTQSSHREAIFNTMDEDQRRARDGGEMGNGRWLCYPRFSKFIHRALPPLPLMKDDIEEFWKQEEVSDPLAHAIRRCNGIPPTWTRYLILDPGHQNCGVLFVAIPPPKIGDFIVPYDELWLHCQNARGIAEAVAAKTRGQYFEEFITDAHAARQTPMGMSGTTIGDNYSKAFRECKLSSRKTLSRFSYGSDNIKGRILLVQGTMNIRSDGTTKMRILSDGCPLLIKQIEKYKWGKDPKENPTDEPARYQKIDLVNCLEYIVSRQDCGYVRPPAQRRDAVTLSSVSASIQGFFRAPKKPDDSIYCGPGVPNR